MSERTNRGVSLLIELLLGFSIVLIALLAVFALFPTAERSTVLADKSTQAYHLANQLLQTQLAKHYSTITPGIFEEEEPIQHTLRKGVEVTTNFHYKIEISKPYAGKEIFNIVVEVSWIEGSSDEPRPAVIKLEGEKGRIW